MSTVLLLFHIAAMYNMKISEFDVSVAFLKGKNDYKLYCYLPSILSKNEKSESVEILKSVYGEKQAPRIWFMHKNANMEAEGYSRCPGCPNLYYNINSDINGKDRIYILVHVDDGIVMAKSN